jgi:hypothetical protein
MWLSTLLSYNRLYNHVGFSLELQLKYVYFRSKHKKKTIEFVETYSIFWDLYDSSQLLYVYSIWEISTWSDQVKSTQWRKSNSAMGVLYWQLAYSRKGQQQRAKQ